MKEMLFNAKRIDNGKWEKGYYVLCRGHHYILPVYDIDHGFDERYSAWVEIDLSTLRRGKVNDVELKPCPFCGGEAEIIYRTDYSAHKFYRIECSECDAGTADFEDEPGKEEAIERWNRRISHEIN